MKNFWKYTLATMCGLLLFGIVVSILSMMTLGAIASLSESETVLKPHSVYVLDLKGTLAEQADEDEFQAAIAEVMNRSSNEVLGLNDIIRNIQLAKENDNIDGIYLRGGELSAGFASMQEIRRELIDFKQSGKFIVAYAQDYGQLNYYLASVADKVFVNQYGGVSWKGLGTTLMFYQRALEKLGVEVQVFKVGTFKSAVEPYIRSNMSDANRLQMNVMLDDMWQEIITDVAQSRNLTIDELNRLADLNMAFASNEELSQSGLIDSMLYSQDMKAQIEILAGTDKYELVSHKKMLNVADNKKYAKDKIAVIYAEGDITDDSGDGIVGTKMVKLIDKIADKDNVKAVVLRVNSPGGSASASEQIWHALTVLKTKKPLVVSMGDYAASGGYYISSAADTILAESNTLTGSIGIFGMVPNFAKVSDKFGLDFDGTATHKHSMMESNMTIKPMPQDEKDMMQRSVNRGYELFVSRCAAGRNMTTDEIKKIAEGRVWSGKRAVQLGLVDRIGNTQDAIEIAANMAQLEKFEVIEYPESKDMFTQLMESLSSTNSEEKILLKEIKQLEQMVQKPSIQARLPYSIYIY